MQLNVLKTRTLLTRASACCGNWCNLVGVEASSEGFFKDSDLYCVVITTVFRPGSSLTSHSGECTHTPAPVGVIIDPTMYPLCSASATVLAYASNTLFIASQVSNVTFSIPSDSPSVPSNRGIAVSSLSQNVVQVTGSSSGTLPSPPAVDSPSLVSWLRHCSVS